MNENRTTLLSYLKILLYPFAMLYGAIIWLRNKLYDAGFLSSVEFSVPVICVGNLSVGGTGKTPHVEYLIRELQYQYKVATLSRGYKRITKGFLLADENSNALRIGDEPMQYHIKYPDIEVCVAEERLTGIPQLLLNRPNVDIILLDDAYQHRSVKAGVNILITDYIRPFYSDYILPYGSLREARKAYKRADIIIVSKCPEALTLTQSILITKQIQPLAHQQVYFSSIRYKEPYDLFTNHPVSIAGKKVILVFCIARPQSLIDYVKTQTPDVHLLSYPDHHYFLSKDIAEIKEPTITGTPKIK